MVGIQSISAVTSQWTNAVASGIVAAMERFISPHVVRLIEREDGAFNVERRGGAPPEPIRFGEGEAAQDLGGIVNGRRVEFVLRPERFMQRPLELPVAAVDFLEGIVRAQIDRLTPWRAQDALFGWTSPVPIGGDRLQVTVVAAPDSEIKRCMTVLDDFRPVAMSAYTTEQGQQIKVHERRARGILDLQRVAIAFRVILFGAIMAAMIATTAATMLGSQWNQQRKALEARIAQRGAALRAGNAAITQSPLRALERRKNDSPATVLILEEISRVLPDNTYVTEMHIESDVLKVSGLTSDAPSLISLIERSRQFSRATFYAPTTRSTSESGERFYIQARIEPVIMAVKN